MDETALVSKRESAARTSTSAKDELYEGFFSAFDKLSNARVKKCESFCKARKNTAGAVQTKETMPKRNM